MKPEIVVALCFWVSSELSSASLREVLLLQMVSIPDLLAFSCILVIFKKCPASSLNRRSEVCIPFPLRLARGGEDVRFADEMLFNLLRNVMNADD